MYQSQIVKATNTFEPLYRRGDKFKIIRINLDKWLKPIEAKSLRTKEVFGFEFEELTEKENDTPNKNNDTEKKDV